MDPMGSVVDIAAKSLLTAGGGEVLLPRAGRGGSGAITKTMGKIKSGMEEVEESMSNVCPTCNSTSATGTVTACEKIPIESGLCYRKVTLI
jgi:hypothetical protein